jgi:putative peptidoglycan lipid II flippase
MFLLRVALASALLAVFLTLAGSAFDWTAMRAHSLQRIGLMALVLLGSAAIYFIALRVLGMNLRQLLQR